MQAFRLYSHFSKRHFSIGVYIEQLRLQSKGSFTELDLRDFKNQITIETNFLPDSPFVKALSKCTEVTHVNISGHSDIKNLEFSCFRKLLPNLKTVTLKNIRPGLFRISSDQLVKYYAKNIFLNADELLLQHITKESCKYLAKNDQVQYSRSIQSGITKDNLDPIPFQKAIAAEIARSEEARKQEDNLEQIRRDSRKQVKLNLFADYQSGRGFNVESPWYKYGPKSESELKNCAFSHTVFTLYIVITKLDCWDAVLQGSGKNGFMFSSPESLREVYAHPAVRSANDVDGHSGHSFAMCMRYIESLARDIADGRENNNTPSLFSTDSIHVLMPK